MKTLLLPLAALLLLACNVKIDTDLPFNLQTVEGKGPIKTKTFNLSFDEIKVSESIKAEIVKADREKVVITAPSDIMDEIVVENEGGRLYVHFKPNKNISARNVAVKIFAKDFSAVEANSSAAISIKDKFTQEKMAVKVSGSASITGHLEANELSIDVSSSGNFSGKIWAIDLRSQVSSSGDLKISGKTKNANLSASSSGTLNAAEVTAERAELRASSSGTVNLAVTGELDASASSSGDINVKKGGNLVILNKKESSAGSVSIF